MKQELTPELIAEIIDAVKDAYIKDYGSLKHNDEMGYFIVGFVKDVLKEFMVKKNIV